MFAMIIWDGARRRMFRRAIYSIKPFLHTQTPRHCAQPHRCALAASDTSTGRLTRRGGRIFLRGTVPEPFTMPHRPRAPRGSYCWVDERGAGSRDRIFRSLRRYAGGRRDNSLAKITPQRRTTQCSNRCVTAW
jgi:hypothetical protein